MGTFAVVFFLDFRIIELFAWMLLQHLKINTLSKSNDLISFRLSCYFYSSNHPHRTHHTHTDMPTHTCISTVHLRIRYNAVLTTHKKKQSWSNIWVF